MGHMTYICRTARIFLPLLKVRLLKVVLFGCIILTKCYRMLQLRAEAPRPLCEVALPFTESLLFLRV